jgi:hypothetical protein
MKTDASVLIIIKCFSAFNKSILKANVNKPRLDFIIKNSCSYFRHPFSIHPFNSHPSPVSQPHKMLVSRTDFHFRMKQINRINIFQLFETCNKKEILSQALFSLLVTCKVFGRFHQKLNFVSLVSSRILI